MRPGKLAEMAGAYVTFAYAPGAVVSSATSRVPTNVPALAGLVQAEFLRFLTNGTCKVTNLTLKSTTSLTGAAQVSLADYRTLRFRPTTTAKYAIVCIGRTAPLGYTGSFHKVEM